MVAEPLTIAAAAPLIRSGELTPSELLEQCLHRIDVYEPAVQAWVYLDRERARRDAARLTDEAKAGRVRGPLHGVPVGVKDIIDVFDMPTGCGSKLWANSYARRDATVVERLRQAGAVILGKTVTTPYAYLDPPPTRNPWDLSRTPGGSSSGSAAAVACGMCLAALGTQTGGSTIRPASYCGVYALKPTHGAISTRGVLPLAPSLDHIGIMANCVRDLATVYEAVANHSGIPVTEEPILPDDFDWYTAGTLEATDAILRGYLASRLSQVIPDVLPRQFVPPVEYPEVRRHHLATMAVEAAQVHADRLDRHPDDYPPEITGLVRAGLATSGLVLAEALHVRTVLHRRMRRRLANDKLMVGSATTDYAPDRSTTGSPALNSPWSFLGLPVVSVVAGHSAAGLRASFQLVGGPNAETGVLTAARWLEGRLDFEHRLPPVPA